MMHRQPPHLIGARGPASGPRADLNRINVGADTHVLFVSKPDGNKEKDVANRRNTLDILQYVNNRLAILREMGIVIRIESITTAMVSKPAFLARMRENGITALPALKVPNVGFYFGVSKIQDVYDKNLRAFEAENRRGHRALAGHVETEDWEDAIRKEMSFERAEEDQEEEGIGASNDDLMNRMARFNERREAAMAKRPGARRAAAAAAPAKKPAARREASDEDSGERQPARAPARRPARDEDSADIDSMIDNMSRNINTTMIDRAYTASSGESFGDDADPADDLMEAAFWARQEQS